MWEREREREREKRDGFLLKVGEEGGGGGGGGEEVLRRSDLTIIGHADSWVTAELSVCSCVV